MSPHISRYPVDVTGRSPTNLVPGEKRNLLNRGGIPQRVVSFSQGGFYANTLKVWDSNYRPLERGVDYIVTYVHTDFSNYSGLPVMQTIVITDTTLTDFVIISAQLVGSDLAFDTDAEVDTINHIVSLNGADPVDGGFEGNPPQWQPGELREALWERHHYGFLNASIERVGQTRVGGDGVNEEMERARIRAEFQRFADEFIGQIQSHINDTNRPHALTKDLVELNFIENYAIADNAVADAGTSNAHYMTPLSVQRMLSTHAWVPLNNHINHLYTAHNPTAAQVGTYDIPQADGYLNLKLGVSETAVSTNRIAYNNTHYANSNWRTEMHRNLPATAFTTGMVHPTIISNTGPSSHMFLDGTGRWNNFYQLVIEQIGYTYNQLHQAGYFESEAAAIANFNVTYGNLQTYPVGTAIHFTVNSVYRHVSYTNGFSGYEYRTYARVAFRSPSGWYVHY